MTYHGHIRDGQITLDAPIVLPEGAEVVTLIERPDGVPQLSELLLRHAGQGRDLPSDLADQHDYYAHGTPKR